MRWKVMLAATFIMRQLIGADSFGRCACSRWTHTCVLKDMLARWRRRHELSLFLLSAAIWAGAGRVSARYRERRA